MKILWLHAYYRPEKMSSTKLDNELESAILEAGHNLVITTPTPTRGCSQEERKRFKKQKHEKRNNLEVIRFPLFEEKSGLVIRFIRYLMGNIIQFNVSRRIRDVDLVLSDSTPPTQGLVAALLTKSLKARSVYAVHDVFPDSLVSAGITKKGSVLWKIGRKIEDYTYKNSDAIVAISEGIKNNLKNKGIPPNKIAVINNWIDTDAVYYVEKQNNVLFDSLGLDRSKFYVVYAGNLGNAQNVDLVLNVAKLLAYESMIEFVVFGSGGEEKKLRKRISEECINNAKLFPLQTIDKISEVYSLGFVGLVLCKKGFGAGAMPSKTWSIMATGRPVIASFDLESELCDVIRSNDLGECVESDNANQLADSIERLYKNPQIASEKGSRALQFVMANCEKRTCTQKYISLFEQLIQ